MRPLESGNPMVNRIFELKHMPRAAGRGPACLVFLHSVGEVEHYVKALPKAMAWRLHAPRDLTTDDTQRIYALGAQGD